MMNEEGLIFSGPMTQPKAELWIKNMEDHFEKNDFKEVRGSRCYSVFYRECCNLVENASSHTRMQRSKNLGIQEDSVEISSYSEEL